MLTIATNYESGTWSSHLTEIQMVYNATVHQSTWVHAELFTFWLRTSSPKFDF